jgi:hypothetical protein
MIQHSAVHVSFGNRRSVAEVGRPLFWSADPLSVAQRTTEMIADQQTGKNSAPALAATEMELPLFRCSAFFGLFLKIFQGEEMSKYWGLIPILILMNSKLRNSELLHAVDYSENRGSGIAELRNSSIGLQ